MNRDALPCSAGVLAVRDFDVMPMGWNFFDNHVQRIRELENEMRDMRQQMYQLVPHDLTDIGKTELEPRGHAIVEERGETKLKLQFDVHQFKPDEVKVKVLGNNILQVVAEHREQSEKGCECRRFLRQYSLPKGVDTANIRPMLTEDGVLTIEAAAPSLQPGEKLIPIEYKKTAAGTV